MAEDKWKWPDDARFLIAWDQDGESRWAWARTAEEARRMKAMLDPVWDVATFERVT